MVREKAACTTHRVNTNSLIKLILETIRLVSEYAITNKEEFVSKVRAASLMNKTKVLRNKRSNIQGMSVGIMS